MCRKILQAGFADRPDGGGERQQRGEEFGGVLGFLHADDQVGRPVGPDALEVVGDDLAAAGVVAAVEPDCPCACLRRQRPRAEALEAIDGMFGHCSSLDQIRLPALPQLSSASELLYGATALRELRLSGLANITSLEGICQDATGLERVWIEDAPRLTTTASLFQGCSNLRQVSLSGAPRISDMSSMFAGCSSLITAPDLETAAVTTMASMFEDCTALRHVPHYDTTGVRSMAWMFSGCWALADDSGLCVTALADSVKLAQQKAYQTALPIAFDGQQMRRDIGHRAIKTSSV